MAWVPIQESGIAFTFSSPSGQASLAASVVTASSANLASFTIGGITQPATLRLTAQSYTADDSGFGFTTQAVFSWAVSGTQSNTTLDGTGFTPSPITMIITEADILGGGGSVVYNRATGAEWAIFETYSFLVEVEAGEIGDPYVIRGTHRAIEGGDNPQTAWVRTETGKLDMSSASELTVDIQRGNKKLLTIPATSPELGKVEFTITSANIKQKLSLLGLFRLYVRADGRVIYTGLLEVLG